MPTMRLRPGLRGGGRGSAPDPTGGPYSAAPHPLAGKGEGPRDGAPGRGNPREGEGRKRRDGGGGNGKIVATVCQILRLKCQDALYKCTDFILTYLLTSVVL